MRLLVNANEVCSQRIRFPETDDFRCVCQLVGIPFREDKEADVFSVHPPLIGARIRVDLMAGGKERQDPMYAMLRPALQQIGRLLWIAGATAITREIDPMAGCSLGGDEQWSRCDARVLVYPGGIRSRMASPSIIYPWWPLPLRGRHLAVHLAAACREFAHFRAGWAQAWGLSADVGSWFSEYIRTATAPTVLFAIPMIEGYVDILLENIALIVCQGIVGSFHEPYLDAAVCREIMRKTVTAEPPRPSRRNEPEEATPGGAAAQGPQDGALTPAVEPVVPAVREIPVSREVQSSGGRPAELDQTQARDFLAAQGVEPSSDLVDEYLLFLKRFPQG